MKKLLSLFLAMAMLIMPLTACTTSSSQKGESAPPPEASTSAAQSEPASEASGEESEDPNAPVKYSGEIVVSVEGLSGYEQGWQNIVAAYKEVQPDVNVVIELKPLDSYGEWLQKEIDAGSPRPDIITGGPQHATGEWVDMFEYVNKPNPYSGNHWGQDIDMSQQKFVSPNGALEIIATEGIKTLLLYNADKFQELGLTPPKTWDDLIAVCEKISTETDYMPLSMAGDEESFTAGVMSWLLIIYGDQYVRDRINDNRAQPGDYCYDEEIDGVWEYDPGDPYNDSSRNVTPNILRVFANFGNGTAPQNFPGSRRMMENLGKVFPKYAQPGFFGTDGNGAYSLFLTQKALMYFGASWDVPKLYNDVQNLESAASSLAEKGVEMDTSSLAPFNFSSVPYPSMNDDLVQAPLRGFEGASPAYAVIRKEKEHNDMVLDFLMFMTTGKNFSKYLDGVVGAGGVPRGINIIPGAVMPEPYGGIMGDIKYGDGNINDYSTVLFRGASNMGSIPEFSREVYNYTKNYMEGKIDIEAWGASHQQNVDTNYEKILEMFKIDPDSLKTPEKEPVA